MPLVRQHLIDPEICIRCNTCEETCPVDAITHDDRNYVIDFAKCNFCGDCLPPCPTGAIDSWRQVATPWSIDDQYGWDSLPADQKEPGTGAPAPIPEEIARLTEVASAGAGGRDPSAGTRRSGPVKVGAKTIVPPLDQAPPRASAASASVSAMRRGAPPTRSTAPT